MFAATCRRPGCRPLIVLAVALLQPVAVARGGQSLTLPQAVDLTLQKNPVILGAREEIRRTHGLIVEVESQRLPTVSANGQTQSEQRERFEEQPTGEFPVVPGVPALPPPTFTRTQQGSWAVGLRVTQTLYAGGRISGNIRIARLQREEALAALETTIQDTVLAVEKSFHEALRQRSLIKVAEQQVQLLEDERADQKKRVEAGTAPQFNVLRAEVELANAQPPLIRSRNNHRIALAELAKLVASDTPPDGKVPFDVVGELEGGGGAYDLAGGIKTALANRSELRGLETRVAAQREQLKVDAAALKPDLSIFGGYDFLGSHFHGFGESTHGAIGGLQAEWKLWDGGEMRGRREQTQARLRAAELDVENTRRQIELEVRKAWSKEVEARELMASQQKNVEVATESLRQANVRFDAGTATQLDVLTSQQALTQARFNELESRADFRNAVSDLRRALGVITPAAPK